MVWQDHSRGQIGSQFYRFPLQFLSRPTQFECDSDQCDLYLISKGVECVILGKHLSASFADHFLFFYLSIIIYHLFTILS